MELRRYAQILRRRWGIAFLGFLATVIATLVFVLPQPWIYESEGSLVVETRQEPGTTYEDRLRAEESLYNNPAIPATYARLTQSDEMESLVETHAQIAVEMDDIDIEATVVIDTTVIEVVVSGPAPEQVHAVITTLLEQMVFRSSNLTYPLAQLDTPQAPPDDPAGPNKPLMIAAGTALGMALALGLALLAEYLKRPAEELAIDDPVTGLRNELYLRERLHEELERTARSKNTTAICLVRIQIRTGENDDVTHAPTPQDLRRIARGLRLTVAPDAVLASISGGIFVVLLPDAERPKADGLRDGWEAAIRALLDWASQGELGPRLQITGGTGEIVGGRLIGASEVETNLRPLAGPDRGPADAVATAPAPTPASRAGGPTPPAWIGGSRQPATEPAARPATAKSKRAPKQPGIERTGARPERPAAKVVELPTAQVVELPTATPVVVPELPPAPNRLPSRSSTATNAQQRHPATPPAPKPKVNQGPKKAAPAAETPAEQATSDQTVELDEVAEPDEVMEPDEAVERTEVVAVETEEAAEATVGEGTERAAEPDASETTSASTGPHGRATRPSAARRAKRRAAAQPSTDGDDATQMQDAAPAPSNGHDGDDGSSREDREESRAGDRSG